MINKRWSKESLRASDRYSQHLSLWCYERFFTVCLLNDTPKIKINWVKLILFFCWIAKSGKIIQKDLGPSTKFMDQTWVIIFAVPTMEVRLGICWVLSRWIPLFPSLFALLKLIFFKLFSTEFYVTASVLFHFFIKNDTFIFLVINFL